MPLIKGYQAEVIETAPRDGSNFVAIGNSVRVRKGKSEVVRVRRRTWWGKTSHLNWWGWCCCPSGDFENTFVWSPTFWIPSTRKDRFGQSVAAD